MKTLEETLFLGTKMLREAGIVEANLDAWYLMEYVFHITRAGYYLAQKDEVLDNDFHRYMELIEKRKERIPLQHLTGVREFMGLEFLVNEHVLIPRQDTEILVEEVLKTSNQKSVLDLCTGSGCIIISLAVLGNLKKATAVDLSEEALKVARNNAQKHQVDISFYLSDLFDQVEERYDMIVSNPPYIATKEIETLEPEVKCYEPMMALDGYEDGLFFYRKIIQNAKNYLTDQGEIFFEIGYDQGNDVSMLLSEAGFVDISVIKDFAGLDRVVKGRLARSI